MMFHADLVQLLYKSIQTLYKPIHVAHQGMTNRFDMLMHFRKLMEARGGCCTNRLGTLISSPAPIRGKPSRCCRHLSHSPTDPKDLCRCKLSRIAIVMECFVRCSTVLCRSRQHVKQPASESKPQEVCASGCFLRKRCGSSAAPSVLPSMSSTFGAFLFLMWNNVALSNCHRRTR